MQGSFSAGINRSEWSTDYLGTNSSGSVDLVNVLASVHPVEKISLTATANYSDNLTGQLIQSVIAAGGVVSGLNTNESSDSLDVMAVASYTAGKGSADLGLLRAPHPGFPRRELTESTPTAEALRTRIRSLMALSIPR